MKFQEVIEAAQPGDKIRRRDWNNSFHITVGPGPNPSLLINSTDTPCKIAKEESFSVKSILADDWEIMEKADNRNIQEGRPFLIKSCNNRQVIIDGIVYEKVKGDVDSLIKEDIYYLDGSDEPTQPQTVQPADKKAAPHQA